MEGEGAARLYLVAVPWVAQMESRPHSSRKRGPLCPEVTRVRCGCRGPQATGCPPSSSAPGPEGLRGGWSQEQKSAGPQAAQETSLLSSGVCPGRGAHSSVCLYLQAVSGVNIPPRPAQSGQPQAWGLALAQEAGLREEVRHLCAEAGARVRLPRAHSRHSDKPLMQSLDAKDGGAVAAFRVAPGSLLVLGRPARVCSHGSREARCWDVC